MNRCLFLLVFAIVPAARADFAVTNYVHHSDLEVSYDPGTGRLGAEVHFEDFPPAFAHYSPAEVLWGLYSPLPLQTTPSPIGPIGYVIPQGPLPGLPILGIAGADEPGEELAPFFLPNSVFIEILGVSGPGSAVVFQDDGLGGFNTFMRSDNLAAFNSIPVPLSGHDDYAWGFTEPGRYQLLARAYGTRNAASGGGVVFSDPFTLNFEAVSTPVPPSLFAAAFGGLSLLTLRRRK